MTSWRGWLRIGLLSTILVALVAFLFRSGPLERDLAARVAERLAIEGQSWASVEVSGRDAHIAGTAPSAESQQTAIAAASGVEGIRSVENRSDLLPVASPYVWSARRIGRVVTMFGYVPSESTRNSVLAGARRALPEAELRDETRLARGASAGFSGATAFALARLADLADGTVTLTDGTIAVTGIAASSAAYSEAREAFRSDLPSAVVLGPVDILPARAEPFVWSAAYNGSELILSGFVPNEVVHEALVATARAALTRVPVVDQAVVASGEPEGFAEAASFALTALGRLTEGGVALDGLNLDIAGVARTVDDYEAVLDGVQNRLPPGVKVVANAIRPATASPYGWEGEKAGPNVVLSGYVPSLEAKAELIRAAASFFAGLSVTDRVRVAAGEPKMDWLGAIRFAMSALAKLGTGKVALGDHTFAIEGEAATPEAFADILDIGGRTLPASLQMVRSEVTPPRVSPYRFVAERGVREVVLAGYAASEKQRQAIVDLARRKFSPDEIVDRLAYASGAPAGLTDAIGIAFQAMTRLGGGRAEIIDAALSIEGDSYHPAAAEAIAESASDALPDGFTLKAAVLARQEGQPATVERCRDLLQAQLQRGRIEFQGQKPVITADSYGLLDRVAATFARCPEARIEVAAHSDSDGSSARNRDLTQARAEAIVDYLVEAGIVREQLTPVGYGETKPIVENTNADNKARNRRIEFLVELPPPPPPPVPPPPPPPPAPPTDGVTPESLAPAEVPAAPSDSPPILPAPDAPGGG